jgi:hypothetical protein
MQIFLIAVNTSFGCGKIYQKPANVKYPMENGRKF